MTRSGLAAFVLVLGLGGAAGAQKPGAPRPEAPSGAPAINLRNDTPNVINNVYISLTSQQNWGQDQLGANEVLRAGATRAFSLPPGECLYDVRIVYQGDISEERRRVDACNEQSLVLPLAAQRARR